MNHRVITMVLLLIVLGGCLSETTMEDESFPFILTDAQGKSVTIQSPPMRIVSLAPSNTEILFSLGLGEKIVGVTEYCNYPEEATTKEKIGGFSTVNIEKVVSLEPDLVIATGGIQTEVVETLNGLGLTVIVLDAKDIFEILENIQLVGRITGKNNEADVLVENLRERIDVVRAGAAAKSHRPKVTYILWGDPIMVAGNSTFVGDIIELAGGINVFSDSQLQYPAVSLESMIEKNPDIIINGDHSGIEQADLQDDPRWKEISAVKNDNVFTINADIVSRQGPRIVDALEFFSHRIEEMEKST